LPLGIAAVGFAVYFFLSPRLPVDQAIRVVLGDTAPRVTGLVIRYVATGAPSGAGGPSVTSSVPPLGGTGGTPEPLREVTFRYAPGAAPRIVSHEPRLPNGEYVVQMELDLTALTPADSSAAAPSRVTLERSVSLQGGTMSIDVSRDLSRGADRGDDR
jgi:hypothetical protein